MNWKFIAAFAFKCAALAPVLARSAWVTVFACPSTKQDAVHCACALHNI